MLGSIFGEMWWVGDEEVSCGRCSGLWDMAGGRWSGGWLSLGRMVVV